MLSAAQSADNSRQVELELKNQFLLFFMLCETSASKCEKLLMVYIVMIIVNLFVSLDWTELKLFLVFVFYKVRISVQKILYYCSHAVWSFLFFVCFWVLESTFNVWVVV